MIQNDSQRLYRLSMFEVFYYVCLDFLGQQFKVQKFASRFLRSLLIRCEIFS